MFCDLVVYFIYPKGVQSFCFAQIAPSVTLECGLAKEPGGVTHAIDFIEKCLRCHSLFEQKPLKPIRLFHTIGTVTIPKNLAFSFGEKSDLTIAPEVEHYNFKELDPETTFAEISDEDTKWFEVKDEFGNSVSPQFFFQDGKKIKLKKKLMPAMITLDKKIIREDCFCYLMERYKIPLEGS
jgi:hypothetical protein